MQDNPEIPIPEKQAFRECLKDLEPFLMSLAKHYVGFTAGLAVSFVGFVGGLAGWIWWLFAAGGFAFSSFQAWRDERAQRIFLLKRNGELTEREANILEIAQRPKLKIELRIGDEKMYYATGEKMGTTEILSEAILIVVTNLGPKVSVSNIDFVVQAESKKDVILTPVPPIPTLPQALDTHFTLPMQRYVFTPGFIETIRRHDPRIRVQTSCGAMFELNSDAFTTITPLFGGKPFSSSSLQ